MKLYYRRDRTRTAYFGSLQDESPVSDKPSEHMPHRGVGDCTGLLLVNKIFSKLALTRLYNRELHLQCSAEGAREFILAHAQKMKLVRQLVLYYHWADDQLGLATDINAWRFLLCTVRHQFSFIPNVRLHIGLEAQRSIQRGKQCFGLPVKRRLSYHRCLQVRSTCQSLGSRG
jgi:hypothetical protein